MNSIGILCSRLDGSELGQLTAQYLNFVAQSRPAYLFTNYASKLPVKYLFPIFNDRDCYFFDGDVIATDMLSARKLIEMCSPRRRYFYVLSYEWMYLKNKRFETICSIYQDKSLELLAGNHEIQTKLRKLFNRDSQVLENFNLGGLGENS